MLVNIPLDILFILVDILSTMFCYIMSSSHFLLSLILIKLYEPFVSTAHSLVDKKYCFHFSIHFSRIKETDLVRWSI